MGKKRKDGWRKNIGVAELDGGELRLNRWKGLDGAIEAYVRGGDPYRAEVRPERLGENAETGKRTTKVEVPGVGTCVLEEKPSGAGGFLMAFEVAVSARSVGIDTYVPYACWERRDGGGRSCCGSGSRGRRSRTRRAGRATGRRSRRGTARSGSWRRC